MRRMMLVGAVAAAVMAIACSDSSSGPNGDSSNQWSSAVIQVAKTDPDANGEIRGIVLDSTESVDPAKATPIAGASVTISNLRVKLPDDPDDTLDITSGFGTVVTDAQGRFLVTNAQAGNYLIVVTPPAGSLYYRNSMWAAVSTMHPQADAVIYLPRRLGSPPPDSVPTGPVPPPPPSSPPPSDTLPTDSVSPPPVVPPTQPPPPDSM